MVEDAPDPDGEGDDESFEARIFERENMANLILLEVEVGGRTCVIGGFTTNGWVTHLSSEDQDNNESSRVMRGAKVTITDNGHLK